MKIYTKTGDKGTTSLIGGKRVLKNSDKLNAYGTIDELNSFLGLLRAKTNDENIKAEILDIQNSLFNVGAHLALDENVEKIPEFAQINDEKIEKIENLIDFFQENFLSHNSIIPRNHEVFFHYVLKSSKALPHALPRQSLLSHHLTS